MPYNFVRTVFTQVLWPRRYEQKYIENQRFRTNAVTLIQNFRYKGSSPPIIFARLVRPMNALQLCCWQFSHKETLYQTFFKRSAFFMEICCFPFLRPPLGDLGATYDDHLRLIGKRVLDFLLALIELFSLGVTAETLRAIIGSKSSVFLAVFLGKYFSQNERQIKNSYDTKLSKKISNPFRPSYCTDISDCRKAEKILLP